MIHGDNFGGGNQTGEPCFAPTPTHGKTSEELHTLLRDGPIPGSLWGHCKGGLYTIITTAISESSLTPVVVYEGNGLRWTRPLHEFLDGRFTKV
jgi:hypothetical protein